MAWYLLIHQLPPRPLYLRAKIRNRLARVGGLALKNSVYVLPERDDCLEDLQWIAQEAGAGGGEAYVCRAEMLGGVSDDELVARFRRRAAADYAALKGEITRALEPQRPGRRGANRVALEASLKRLEKRRAEIAGVDFFDAVPGKEVEAMLRTLDARVHGRKRATDAPQLEDLVGRTWVTRRGPKVDRLACAWLVRRFVDPGARFRFVDPAREPLRSGELGFDMVGGTFAHQGDGCSFETLLARIGASDPALRAIAQIVHDLDLKDARYGRDETPGVARLIEGLVRGHPDDQGRLDAGFALFDQLYASYRATRPARARVRRGKVR